MLFVAGLLAPVYRPVFLWPLLVVLGAGAIWRIARRRPRPDFRLPWRSFAAGEWITLGWIAFYGYRWFRTLAGFAGGSDVFGHHYPHTKLMATIGRFAHESLLPLGLDHISNYNPALMHVLFVPGHALVDERVSNLLHWAVDLMVIASVYLVGRVISSRAAGLLAVAIYLTAGVIANFAIDVGDYPLTAVFLLLSLAAVFRYARTGSASDIVLSALLGGLAMSAKYYGMVAFPFVCALVLAVSPHPWRKRVAHAVICGLIALAVFVPWPLHNWMAHGNPFYPMFSDEFMPRVYAATNPVHVISLFVAPGDRSFVAPQITSWTSLFFPFQFPLSIFALSVIFLIGLPLSAACLGHWRDPRIRHANLLFVFSLLVFAAMFAAIAKIAFWKWAFFAALPYAASLAVLAQTWRRGTRAVLWAAVLIAVFANYRYTVGTILDSAGAAQPRQSDRWDPVAKRLNATLPRNAVVAGLWYGPNYYLRDDLTGIEEQEGLGIDWAQEEAILREKRVQFYVVNPNEEKLAHDWYNRLIALWRQLAPAETGKIAFLEELIRGTTERVRAKQAFLARSAQVVETLPDGTVLYRLR